MSDHDHHDTTDSQRTQAGLRFWAAVIIGIGVTLVLFFGGLGWYRSSSDVPELVARVIVVGSVVVAAGSLLQLGAHHETGHRFVDALGKALVASGACLVALVSVLGALPNGFI